MEIKFNNSFEFKIALEAGKITTPKFINLVNYKSKNEEVADHLLNLGVHYGKTLEKDLTRFSFLSIEDFNISDELMPYANEAYNEKLESLQANTDKNRDNHTPASRRNLDLYETITPNIKMHKENGNLYLVGFSVRKTVKVPGVYKKVNHKPKTLVKMEMDKALSSPKYRMYFLNQIH